MYVDGVMCTCGGFPSTFGLLGQVRDLDWGRRSSGWNSQNPAAILQERLATGCRNSGCLLLLQEEDLFISLRDLQRLLYEHGVDDLGVFRVGGVGGVEA